ncbi:glycosyltransferase [Fluviibacterium sp. DFM31]|uniref:Glycosyltransferase n=1 Tax=Meridianimarinicoccus marinus TaxID=3231483 RepID=A0ABV3L8Z8_9RHOB
MSSVTILLCTHNGARFLQAQLESIAAQTWTDWALWISDDGSTDGTLDILRDFREAHPGREIRLLSGAGCGAAANYLALLCHPDLGPRRIAFCDQDDMWLPEKLARAVARLNKYGDNAPACYAAGSTVTDADLTPIGRLHTEGTTPSLKNALVQNVLHGSTIVLTAAAHDLLRQAGPVSVPFHDWWCYLALTACNVPIELEDAPALLYRQHGDNHIGYNKGAGAGRKRYRLIAEGIFRGWLTQNAEALLHADLPMTPDARTLCRDYLALQDRPAVARMLGYRRLGLRRQSRPGTLLLHAFAGLGYV